MTWRVDCGRQGCSTSAGTATTTTSVSTGSGRRLGATHRGDLGRHPDVDHRALAHRGRQVVGRDTDRHLDQVRPGLRREGRARQQLASGDRRGSGWSPSGSVVRGGEVAVGRARRRGSGPVAARRRPASSVAPAGRSRATAQTPTVSSAAAISRAPTTTEPATRTRARAAAVGCATPVVGCGWPAVPRVLRSVRGEGHRGVLSPRSSTGNACQTVATADIRWQSGAHERDAAGSCSWPTWPRCSTSPVPRSTRSCVARSSRPSRSAAAGSGASRPASSRPTSSGPTPTPSSSCATTRSSRGPRLRKD